MISVIAAVSVKKIKCVNVVSMKGKVDLLIAASDPTIELLVFKPRHDTKYALQLNNLQVGRHKFLIALKISMSTNRVQLLTVVKCEPTKIICYEVVRKLWDAHSFQYLMTDGGSPMRISLPKVVHLFAVEHNMMSFRRWFFDPTNVLIYETASRQQREFSLRSSYDAVKNLLNLDDQELFLFKFRATSNINEFVPSLLKLIENKTIVKIITKIDNELKAQGLSDDQKNCLIDLKVYAKFNGQLALLCFILRKTSSDISDQRVLRRIRKFLIKTHPKISTPWHTHLIESLNFFCAIENSGINTLGSSLIASYTLHSYFRGYEDLTLDEVFMMFCRIAKGMVVDDHDAPIARFSRMIYEKSVEFEILDESFQPLV